jgi:hypothetical protein
VLGSFMLLVGLASGHDPWRLIKFPALWLYRGAATEPGLAPAPVLVGFLTHFAVSIGWGVLFALLSFGLSRGSTVVAGLGFGVLVWGVMSYVVLPVLSAEKLARGFPVSLLIYEHLVFGAALAAGFLPFQRTHERHPRILGRLGALAVAFRHKEP